MNITETDLPGVGKKHEIELRSDEIAVVVTYNTGKRELLKKENEDADTEKLFNLTDQEARTLGTVLEGAYFQPVKSGDVETILADGNVIEWIEVPDDSQIIGERVGDQTGKAVTAIAIQRDGELLTGEPPATTFQNGDVVVVVGSADACEAFEERTTRDG
jgi:TrkA domain protein